jgi:uncharacterized membrane protein YjjB (DUF3815 family)
VDEFTEEDLAVPVEEPRHRVSWAAVVGAAFGLVIGAILVRYGFWPALATLILAVVGGFLGRYYVGD